MCEKTKGALETFRNKLILKSSTNMFHKSAKGFETLFQTDGVNPNDVVNYRSRMPFASQPQKLANLVFIPEAMEEPRIISVELSILVEVLEHVIFRGYVPKRRSTKNPGKLTVGKQNCQTSFTKQIGFLLIQESVSPPKDRKVSAQPPQASRN
jgi:hypothetical protein